MRAQTPVNVNVGLVVDNAVFPDGVAFVSKASELLRRKNITDYQLV